MYGLRERLTRQQSLAFIFDFRKKWRFVKKVFLGGSCVYNSICDR